MLNRTIRKFRYIIIQGSVTTWILRKFGNVARQQLKVHGENDLVELNINFQVRVYFL